MNPQPELFDAKKLVKPGSVSKSDVEWFEKLLEGAGCWMTAGDICLSVGLTLNDDSKRWIKALRAASAFVIAGQKGYRHLSHATAEEIDHAAHRLESMARTLTEQAVTLRRSAHKILG